MKSYYYRLICKYIGMVVRPGDRFLEVDPPNGRVLGRFPNAVAAYRPGGRAGRLSGVPAVEWGDIMAFDPHYVLLNGTIHYERDIQRVLEDVRSVCSPGTRVVVVYYSSLWRPLARLATALGLRDRQPETNWISHDDAENLLALSGFESVRRSSHVLFPFPVPLLAGLFNRILAPLPFFRMFNLVNLALARPVGLDTGHGSQMPSVSVVVPARNEAGNIAEAVGRIPAMGPDDEIVFVEGHSRDDTWDRIQDVVKAGGNGKRVIAFQQKGRGKGDAVRTGFSHATRQILMILDADLTVPPEDLPRFYRAITGGRGEFINGSRLVYPMEKGAMRFVNLLGNKFFASAFSFVLGQRFKDTLCGTKVLYRADYLRIARNRSFFGDFDPFGDFDLIFGAARMGLKIREVPVVYRERKYGATNISRWRHGWLLLSMLAFAARKIKFI